MAKKEKPGVEISKNETPGVAKAGSGKKRGFPWKTTAVAAGAFGLFTALSQCDGNDEPPVSSSMQIPPDTESDRPYTYFYRVSGDAEIELPDAPDLTFIVKDNSCVEGNTGPDGESVYMRNRRIIVTAYQKNGIQAVTGGIKRENLRNAGIDNGACVAVFEQVSNGEPEIIDTGRSVLLQTKRDIYLYDAPNAALPVATTGASMCLKTTGNVTADLSRFEATVQFDGKTYTLWANENFPSFGPAPRYTTEESCAAKLNTNGNKLTPN